MRLDRSVFVVLLTACTQLGNDPSGTPTRGDSRTVELELKRVP